MGATGETVPVIADMGGAVVAFDVEMTTDIGRVISDRAQAAARAHVRSDSVRNKKHVIVVRKTGTGMSGMQVLTKREDLVEILDRVDDANYRYVSSNNDTPFEATGIARATLLAEFDNANYKQRAFVLILHPVQFNDAPDVEGVACAKLVTW